MFWDSFLDFLFPPVCVGCGASLHGGQTICERCFSEIPLNRTLFCGLCGARLAENKRICHRDFPYVLGAAADYGKEPVKGLIHRLKFNFSKKAAEPLAELLVDYANGLRLDLKGWLVVPLPLSSRRFRERGFNQAAIIAGTFARRLNLFLNTQALCRLKHSQPQSETKSAGERAENVKGCFAVVNRAALLGQKVILLDDVTTSGATFLEAARALKAAGARRIIALAAAKA